MDGKIFKNLELFLQYFLCFTTITMNPKTHYDNLYKHDKRIFADGKSSPLLDELLKYVQGGSVYEIGAGEGRNGLYLASKGFDVEMNDLSDVGIKKIKKQAKERGLNIKTNTDDIRKIKELPESDIFISTFVFHHLTIKEGFQIISKIKKATKRGGFNVISAFTKEGDFYEKFPSQDKFYLEKEELKELYSGWGILTYGEKEGTAYEKHKDGTPMKNVSACIVARNV